MMASVTQALEERAMAPATHFYVLNLNYIRPINEVEVLVDAHNRYIEAGFQRGAFLLAGRKVPWTGGIILARAASRDEVRAIIAEDPYLRANVTTYEITEFNPSRASADLTMVVPAAPH
jgi:uncharacterized protein YciI